MNYPHYDSFFFSFIKLQLYGPAAVILAQAVLKGSFHIFECRTSRLFYLWVAELGRRACPFSNLFFKSISHCSISWVCSDAQGIAAPGGYKGKNRNTNIWKARGLLSALFWLWCPTYLRRSVGGNQREGCKGEEMSQNSYTNDWSKPRRFLSEFSVSAHGI